MYKVTDFYWKIKTSFDLLTTIKILYDYYLRHLILKDQFLQTNNATIQKQKSS